MALLLVLISPAVGSFLGVLVDRLPRGEDVIRQPSACRTCGQTLAWADLVPLVSYLRRRGVCGACGDPIPAFVPLVEVGATATAIICVMLARSDLQAVLGCLLLWSLLALAVSDVLWFRLPDVLTGAVFVIALALVLEDPGRDLAAAGLGAAVGAGAFLAIRISYRAIRGRDGLGLGDVKLMAGLGALMGVAQLPLMVLIAAVLALAAALFQGRALNRATPLPFGSALSVAAGALWLVSL